MRVFDALERGIVFPLMRLIALLCILALFVASAAAILGHFVGNADAVEPAAQERMVEATEDSENTGEVEVQAQDFADSASGVRETVSQAVASVKESVPKAKDVASAAKVYAAGFLEQFRDGLVFGTLARMNWMMSVIFVTASAALAGFFCLVLAFLAIERNTRRNDN